MNSGYGHAKNANEQKLDLKEHIKKIFQSHYFSNHWQFAISLENELNKITGNKHNVTYMNSSVALISMLHILELSRGDSVRVARGVALFPWVQSCFDYMGLDSCSVDDLKECGRNDVLIALDIDQDSEGKLENHFSNRTIIIPTKLSYQASKNNGCVRIYDMGSDTCFGMSTGAFVSLNVDDYADKLRWMRSSYGRTGNVSVPINGNGRFSEIQAAEALSAIRINKLKGNVFSDMNAEVSKVIPDSDPKVQFFCSGYTSGIIKVTNANQKAIDTVQSLSTKNGILYDVIRDEDVDNIILIKIPMDAGSRKSLLSILNMNISA